MGCKEWCERESGVKRVVEGKWDEESGVTENGVKIVV